MSSGTGSAAVVVLGDLARSPRMRAHAAALAAAGWRVSLIGYVEDNVAVDGVEVVPLRDPLGERARAARGAARAGWTALRLALVAQGLWSALRGRFDTVLVQNPPALPTLAVARLACALSGARLVVDWHNFGSAMLALRTGPGLVAQVAGWLERTLARGAAAHLCVTRAMQRKLAEWGIAAEVLPDLPRAPVHAWSRAEARRRLAELIDLPEPDAVVVMTATSWTLDEAHEMLVEAVDRCAARGGAGARAVVVFTGRGPGRAAFEGALARRPAGAPRVQLVWVAEVDYEAILRGADVGVSLHRSASGVDFPMKIVDMRAAGLPVLALDYGAALGEGFAAGRDGYSFRDAGELADLLDRVVAARGAPECAGTHHPEDWGSAWERVARPLIAGRA